LADSEPVRVTAAPKRAWRSLEARRADAGDTVSRSHDRPSDIRQIKMKAPIAGSDQGLASRHLVPSRTQRRGRWGRKREGYSYATRVTSLRYRHFGTNFTGHPPSSSLSAGLRSGLARHQGRRVGIDVAISTTNLAAWLKSLGRLGWVMARPCGPHRNGTLPSWDYEEAADW